MSKWSARVPIPAPASVNRGLSYCQPRTVLGIFGPPAVPLPTECGQPTSAVLVASLVTANVGPFRVTGVRPAVESLTRIFDRVRAAEPTLYAATGTAGMLCVRCIRGRADLPSNHAFGAAIDVKMDGVLVPYGSPWAQAGHLALLPYFAAEGWFWGGVWDKADAMHWEASNELMLRWAAQGLFRLGGQVARLPSARPRRPLG